MIEQKTKLAIDKPVFEQILQHHGLNYKELAEKLEITDRALRKIRSGNASLRMSMSQVKTLSALLSPFGVMLQELPNDWMVEKK
ncbi:MAG: hypothetical protein QNJ64_08470 [Crocosphaera sp.]|nr:hypothetical protein [Crocosphaera sp.]